MKTLHRKNNFFKSLASPSRVLQKKPGQVRLFSSHFSSKINQQAHLKTNNNNCLAALQTTFSPKKHALAASPSSQLLTFSRTFANRKTFTKETLQNIFDFKKSHRPKDRKKVPVILTSDHVPSLGYKGEIKLVTKGYYRNFLWPKVYAIRYSKEALNMIGDPDEEKVQAREKERKQKRAIKKLSGREFFFTKLSLDERNLMYPLSANDLTRTFQKKYNLDFSPEQLVIDNDAVEQIGTTDISVKIQDILIPIKITVKRHNHATSNNLPPAPAKVTKPLRVRQAETHQRTYEERMNKYQALIEELKMKRLNQ